MGTVRNSVKLTGTLLVIAVAAVLMQYWYSVSDAEYFNMVKALMQTRDQIGGVHVFFINAAFWISTVDAIANAALNDKFGFNILSAAWIPLAIMCCLVLLFIPSIGFVNIHLFWLICYTLVIIGAWLSGRQIGRFCADNSNFTEMLKDPDVKLELKVDRIDFIAAMLLMFLSYLVMGLAVIGALVFGIGNRELIAGTGDVTLAVYSVRYDTAVGFMNDSEYEKEMIGSRDLEGIRLMDQDEYDEARSTFWSVYEYKDSAELAGTPVDPLVPDTVLCRRHPQPLPQHLG